MSRLRAETYSGILLSATIAVRQDSDGRLAQVDITSKKKRLKVLYVYQNQALTLKLEGDKSLLPSFADLLSMIDAKFTERVAVVEKQPQLEDLTRIEWLTDGSYPERWEQGFRKILYHGRTGAYWKSESAKNVGYKDWTLPEIRLGANTIGTSPWKNALLMRNSIDGKIMDELYIGFPKAHHREKMMFEAKLPSPAAGKPDSQFIGFEINSGGAFGFLVCLMCEAGQWKLKKLGYDGVTDVNVTLNNPDVFARYTLVLDPPYFELWEAAAGTPSVFPLTRTAICDLDKLRGKGIPFFANEDTTAISEFQVGDIWVSELETPRPKRLKTATGRINATGLLSLKAAGYLVKIHSFTLNSESDGQTVYFYEETSGTKIGLSMPLNAREGYSVAHTLIQTAVLGKDIGLNLAAASFVNYTVEYSNDDWA